MDQEISWRATSEPDAMGKDKITTKTLDTVTPRT